MGDDGCVFESQLTRGSSACAISMQKNAPMAFSHIQKNIHMKLNVKAFEHRERTVASAGVILREHADIMCYISPHEEK